MDSQIAQCVMTINFKGRSMAFISKSTALSALAALSVASNLIFISANHAAFAADEPIATDAQQPVKMSSEKPSVAEALSGDVSQKGFSFFLGLGLANVRYQETSTSIPTNSSAQATNLILNSGALYALNQDYLFSIEAQSTFYPQNVTESWTAPVPFSAGGYNFTSGMLQQDNFSISQSDTRLYLHKRISGNYFLLLGPSFDSSTFKRSMFVAYQTGVNVNNSTVIEESSSEILGNIGIGIDTEQVINRPYHYSANITFGLPVWRRVTNTSYSLDTFTSTQGYDLAIEGRYSWAFRKDAQIGAWMRYSESIRGNQILGPVELPTSKMDSASFGLEILWKI